MSIFCGKYKFLCLRMNLFNKFVCLWEINCWKKNAHTKHTHPVQFFIMARPSKLPYFYHPAKMLHSSYTKDSDNMERKLGNVHRSYSLGNGWCRCLAVGLFSVAMLTASSTLYGDFGTMSWFVLRWDLNFSTDPSVCWRSDICPVWIHFLISPIAWRCTLGEVFDRRQVCGIVCQTVSVLLIKER